MERSRKAIVVIPARGRSKRFPRKNIALLASRPLISYAIAASLAAQWVDEVYVTTEDEEIAAVAKNEGAIVPYMRPMELAGDTVPADEAVKHLVRYILDKERRSVEIVVIIQPTSPFVQPDHIDSAIEMFFDKPFLDSVTTLTEVNHRGHPYNIGRIVEGDLWDFIFAEERMKAPTRQAKPTVHRFGNLFAVRTEVLFKHGRFGPCKGALVIDALHGWDIDYEWELKVAEFLLQKRLVDMGSSFVESQ